MTYEARSPEEYIIQIPEDRKEPFSMLRNTILCNISSEIEEEMSYGMIGYVIPHSIYPDGYHTDPKLPLPFLNLASQKNFIAFYHMGLYDKKLTNWFQMAYQNKYKKKADMGKSCIRFKKMNEIPYDLIAELIKKSSVKEYITNYKTTLKQEK